MEVREINIISAEITDETSLYLIMEGGFIDQSVYDHLLEGINSQGYCVIRGGREWIQDVYNYVQLNTYGT